MTPPYPLPRNCTRGQAFQLGVRQVGSRAKPPPRERVAKGRSTRLMLFGRRKPTPPPEASRMGFRSRLVLAKLGFDLRQQDDALIGRELPDELGRLASQLNPSVVDVGHEPKQRGRRWARH